MTQQNHAAQLPPERKNGHKQEPIVIPEGASALSGITELSGLLGAQGHGDSKSPAVLLGDPRVYPIQQQIIATQIGQRQGNQYLQRMIFRTARNGDGQSSENSSVIVAPRTQNALVIQRDETEGTLTEEKPSAEEEAADRAQSKKSSGNIQQLINDQYWEIHLRIANAEQLNYSPKRGEWLRRLEAEGAELKKIFEKAEPVGMVDVLPLRERLFKLTKEVDAENKEALTVWKNQNNRYAQERERLVEQNDYESELGIKFLDQSFDETEKRVSAILASNTDALVQDDIGSLIYVLDNDTHLRSARSVMEREQNEAKERMDALSQVQEEGPGFFEMAWSIIGCDSVGECLGDVALTVATAGAGKLAKFAVKGVKAAEKINKVRKIIRSVEKLGKTLYKVFKKVKGLEDFVRLIKGSVVDAATTYLKWLQGDWKKVISKISTDLYSGYATHRGRSIGTASLARINKEFIASIIDKDFGIHKPNPTHIDVAIIFFLKKNKAAGSLVRTFILESLKYRTAVNVTFEILQAATPLSQFDAVLGRTLSSTISECAQDLVQAIPFVGDSSVGKYATELIRKTVQRLVT